MICSDECCVCGFQRTIQPPGVLVVLVRVLLVVLISLLLVVLVSLVLVVLLNVLLVVLQHASKALVSWLAIKVGKGEIDQFVELCSLLLTFGNHTWCWGSELLCHTFYPSAN